ncbi:MAG: hypothetical protein WCW90_03570, partial [Candidatus Paceibacterota bacterium]
MKYGKRTLGQVEAIFNKLGGDSAVERILSGELVVSVVEAIKTVADKLLEFINTVTVPATGNFVAKNHFIINTAQDALVRIGWMGDDFREHFLSKIEDASGEMELFYYKLRQPSRDIPILSELGGDETRVETTLSKLWELLELQGRGQDGVLLTNGYANVFYVRDPDG